MPKVIRPLINFLKRTDIIFWLLTIAATSYGLILISSMSRAGSGSGRGFFITQLIGVAIGYFAAVIISLMDYNMISKWWLYLSVFGILVLVYTLFFGWGPDGLDDKAWVSFGPVNFQPSELVKIFFIVTFAKHVSFLKNKAKLKTFIGVLSLLSHALIPVVLVHFQGDDGTALVFVFMFLFMALGSGVQLRYFLISFVSLLVAIPVIWNSFLDQDQKSRFLAVFDLDSNMLGKGWQQFQGKISIASGELSGRGLFNGSRVSEGIVPYQESDFIFTVAGEELGFIGCVILILLLFILSLRALRVASSSKDAIGVCVCFGFFGMIFSQAIINISMCLGLIPVIGITLPFFSAGGSSVVCLYLGVGLVQSVYMHRERDEEVKVDIRNLNARKFKV